MANPSKRKGTAWEVQAVAYARENGFPFVERRALSGRNDMGDMSGSPYVWEMKDQQAISLAQWMDELVVEIGNAKVRFGFLIIKRRRKSTKDAYAVMSYEQLLELLSLIGDQGGAI